MLCLTSNKAVARYESKARFAIKTFKGSFKLILSVRAAMLLVISLSFNCLDFLIKQASQPKNWLQPQLIRYDERVDTDAPNQSLTYSVNEP